MGGRISRGLLRNAQEVCEQTILCLFVYMCHNDQIISLLKNVPSYLHTDIFYYYISGRLVVQERHFNLFLLQEARVTLDTELGRCPIRTFASCF